MCRLQAAAERKADSASCRQPAIDRLAHALAGLPTVAASEGSAWRRNRVERPSSAADAATEGILRMPLAPTRLAIRSRERSERLAKDGGESVRLD